MGSSSDTAQSQVVAEHPLPVNPPTSTDSIVAPSMRKIAPDFTLPDSNDQPLHLSAYKGKVVLLNFWATWCGGCKYEMPWFVEFDKKYRDKGLSVVGISMDENMKIVKPFLVAKGVPYPSVLGDDALGQRFGLKEMPLTLLIDRQGRIAVVHSGVVDRDNFEMHIQQLLGS
jgi:cytochrome c biogenesis protein CcmG/thiol:disulfide interchange protein DsbE